MFSKSIIQKLKFTIIFLAFSGFFSCEEDISITFSETNMLIDHEAVVEINIPKAEGDKIVSNNINQSLENFIKQALNIDASNDVAEDIKESIKAFNKSYENFKSELPIEIQKDATPWEASIEGEVTYQSPQVICIAMNKYLNTGGAHGTSKVTFLNFDAQTGKLLNYEDFITDKGELKKFLKFKFEKEVEPIAFDDFKLPETIGLNSEGAIILYNVNEIPSYTDSLTEFTVPFDEIQDFLKIY